MRNVSLSLAKIASDPRGPRCVESLAEEAPMWNSRKCRSILTMMRMQRAGLVDIPRSYRRRGCESVGEDLGDAVGHFVDRVRNQMLVIVLVLVIVIVIVIVVLLVSMTMTMIVAV